MRLLVIKLTFTNAFILGRCSSIFVVHLARGEWESGRVAAKTKNYATATAAQQLLTHAASGHCCVANTTADNG